MTNHPSGASPVVCSQPVASLRKYFTIGQLAREFGLTLRTLRFYEDRRLISPTREGSTRLYSQRDRARLAMIVRAKALGFTLSEIKETLAEGTLAGEPHGLALSSSQIADQIAHLEKQQADLVAALAELRALRAKLVAPRAA
jgi:DNA-binding transcriptional MerR regulator